MKPTEAQIHASFVDYVEHKYPRLAPYLIHIPNEGKRSLAEGGKQKRLGLRKGVPDLLFAMPSVFKNFRKERWPGAWIEIKAPGKKLRREQQEYFDRLAAAGYFVGCYDNIDILIRDFEWYIEGMTDDKGRDRKDIEDTGAET